MNTSAIFSKTSKGISALKNRSADLSGDHYKALSLVDGFSTVQVLADANASAFGADARDSFYAALVHLEKSGFIHLFKDQANPSIRTEGAATADFHANDDLAHPRTIIDAEAVELSLEDSVQAWAEARRAAEKLATEGFFTGWTARPHASFNVVAG